MATKEITIVDETGSRQAFPSWKSAQEYIDKFRETQITKSLPNAQTKTFGGHSYGCLMAMLSDPIRKQITDWVIETIPDFHLAKDGRELTPHVTIKYGFVNDSEETVNEIRSLLTRNGPITIKLGNTLSLFPGHDDSGAVLKIDVESPELFALNSIISDSFECVDTYPDYRPHVTLAYLTPDASQLYVEETPAFLGQVVAVTEAEWSNKEGLKQTIPLSFHDMGAVLADYDTNKRMSPNLTGLEIPDSEKSISNLATYIQKAKQQSGVRDVTLDSFCEQFADSLHDILAKAGIYSTVVSKQSNEDPIYHTFVKVGNQYIDASGSYGSSESLISNFAKVNGLQGQWKWKSLPTQTKDTATSNINAIVTDIQKVCEKFNALPDVGPDYQRAFYHPTLRSIWWESADGDAPKSVAEIMLQLKQVPGLLEVNGESEKAPPEDKGWILIWPKSQERAWKSMSWMNNSSGGALVGSPKTPKIKDTNSGLGDVVDSRVVNGYTVNKIIGQITIPRDDYDSSKITYRWTITRNGVEKARFNNERDAMRSAMSGGYKTLWTNRRQLRKSGVQVRTKRWPFGSSKPKEGGDPKGGPCTPGHTQTRDGCIPEEHEGGGSKKPAGSSGTRKVPIKKTKDANPIVSITHLKSKYPELEALYNQHSGTEMGSVGSHTADVARVWQDQISPKELDDISERWGSDVASLMSDTVALHDIGKGRAVEEGDKHLQHKYTVEIMKKVLAKEGYSPKEIQLAVELVNHDLIGEMAKGGIRKDPNEVPNIIADKAHKVGMDVKDFVALQLSLYHADAGAYPYVRNNHMKQDANGKLSMNKSERLDPLLRLEQNSGTTPHTSHAETTAGNASPLPNRAESSSVPLTPEQAEHRERVRAQSREEYHKMGTKAPSFKAWFGDWENDPASASKVINSDGEPAINNPSMVSAVTDGEKPRVVFHGTPHGSFEQFMEESQKNADGLRYGPGFYFTEDETVADIYAHSNRLTGDEEPDKPTIMRTYLSIKKPFDLDTKQIKTTELPESEKKGLRSLLVQKALIEDGPGAAREAGKDFDAGDMYFKYSELSDTYGVNKTKLNQMLQQQGYDGLTIMSRDDASIPNRHWITFKPTQIKAINNEGTFDPDDPSIHKSLPSSKSRFQSRKKSKSGSMKGKPCTAGHTTERDGCVSHDPKGTAGGPHREEPKNTKVAKESANSPSDAPKYQSRIGRLVSKIGSVFHHKPSEEDHGKRGIHDNHLDGGNATSKKYGIPPDEQKALQRWTQFMSDDIREDIATGHPTDLSDAFLSGLMRLPNYEGVVYRGVGPSYADQRPVEVLMPGDIWFDKAPASMSTKVDQSEVYSVDDMEKQSANPDDPTIHHHTMFVIKCKTGKYISDFDRFGDQHEIVSLPGTQYRVTEVKGPGKHSTTYNHDRTVYMEEI